jgi:NitT/TauT family transport system substrate-binding protein
VADVELVIGKDGKPFDGGIWVFNRDEAARFMRVKDGAVPMGGANGIQDHWKLTNEWWLKFGLMKETLPPEAGIELGPIKSAVAAMK